MKTCPEASPGSLTILQLTTSTAIHPRRRLSLSAALSGPGDHKGARDLTTDTLEEG
jgi:hypothetical protein